MCIRDRYGRVSDVPWAMVFPRGGSEPRHPSQLYEAALERLTREIAVVNGFEEAISGQEINEILVSRIV